MKTEKSTRSISYVDESAVVFRVAWYALALKPGAYLTEYSEPESQTFEGKARFSIGSEGNSFEAGISVNELESIINIDAVGANKDEINAFLNEASDVINAALDKYRILSTDEKSRVRRALVAKTCWDRLVHLILKKKPFSEIYYQLAHGREMMIKATERDTIHPITLSTSGWLANVENLPRDEPLPGNLASSLAKKSIEWKRDTQDVIKRYL
ncbi:MAG: hypothetical protein P1Q69_07545 [Candidatus Thorarchaeota archaeon]|nr:hypothetical protein [Candidatus Thorarchaeota archaeon]